MREIKFRAWNKKKRCFIYHNTMNIKICDINNSNYKDLLVFQQYTGLKDKNGIEIYEGDILKCKLYNDRYENYKVSWNEKEGMFEALNKFNTNFIDYTMWNEFEIIGNLYETSELMEE